MGQELEVHRPISSVQDQHRNDPRADASVDAGADADGNEHADVGVVCPVRGQSSLCLLLPEEEAVCLGMVVLFPFLVRVVPSSLFPLVPDQIDVSSPFPCLVHALPKKEQVMAMVVASPPTLPVRAIERIVL